MDDGVYISSASASLAKKQCALGFLLFLRSLQGHGLLTFEHSSCFLLFLFFIFIIIVFLHSLGDIFCY